MYTLVTDNAEIATEATVFSMVQQSPVAAQTVLNNYGGAIIAYRFQQSIAGTWTDMDDLPSPYNNTLSPAQTVALSVVSDYPQVRLVASAGGAGSSLSFAVQRFSNRPDGGIVPLLSI